MKYELAKQLKEAGFPQKGNGSYLIRLFSKDYGETITGATNKSTANDYKDTAYIPTLEEVIEELGGRFLLVRKNGENRWFAYLNTEATASKECVGEGYSTPLEAVSNLYIKLKK